MKISKPFVFKQFSVNQDKCALKVNTDAVLLGALAQAVNPENILDIGTGTGVISLMLAQRYQTSLVHSVEIEQQAFLQAQENFSMSPWKSRMEVFHMPFQQFGERVEGKYDLIVSNPPYYSDHLKSLSHERNIALHSESLSFAELSKGVGEKLSDKGEFFAILPERQMDLLEKSLAEYGMYPTGKVFIRDKPGTQVLRVIRSFSLRAGSITVEKEIFIKDSNGNYSSEYALLLREFLLIF